MIEIPGIYVERKLSLRLIARREAKGFGLKVLH